MNTLNDKIWIKFMFYKPYNYSIKSLEWDQHHGW